MSEVGGPKAIDHPVRIEIRQANTESDAESDVPILLLLIRNDRGTNPIEMSV